jgi:tetratricopeptide (TPR) repeat protein
MNNTTGKIVGLALAIFVVLPASARISSFAPQGQQGQQQQGQQGQQGQAQPGQQPGQTAAPPPVDPAEEAAYKAFHDVKSSDAKQITTDGEAFLTKYPSSRYNGLVYSRLTTAYMQLGEEDKMFAAGEKALELVPDNVDVLPVMAMTTSRRINTSQIDADQKLRITETYARQGIQILNALQKPADLPEADFDKARDEKLAMCHSGLGLVYYDRTKYMEASQEFEEAVKLEGEPDPVDQYLLGNSLMSAKQFTQAITVLEDCAKPGGQMEGPCKKVLDNAKKQAAAQPKQ